MEETKDYRIIKIGKLKISLQSLIIVIGGIFLSLILSVFLNIWVGLGLLPIFLLSAYNVNCTLVGHCTIWAWILTSLFLIQVLSYLLIFIVNGPETLKNVLKRM